MTKRIAFLGAALLAGTVFAGAETIEEGRKRLMEEARAKALAQGLKPVTETPTPVEQPQPVSLEQWAAGSFSNKKTPLKAAGSAPEIKPAAAGQPDSSKENHTEDGGDPWGDLLHKLEKKYDVKLIPLQVRCPCRAYTVVEEGKELGMIKVNFAEKEQDKLLEERLKALALPGLESGTGQDEPKKRPVAIEVEESARRVIGEWGWTLEGDTIKMKSGGVLELNGDGKTLRAHLAGNSDAQTLYIVVEEQDGGTRTARKYRVSQDESLTEF